MSKEKNKDKGDWGEAQARRYLVKNGHCILAQNYKKKTGEIDIISSIGDTIVFTEVKYRRSLAYGTPGQAVDVKRQRRMAKTALLYLQSMALFEKNVRFDVIEIYQAEGKHWLRQIKNAFEMPL